MILHALIKLITMELLLDLFIQRAGTADTTMRILLYCGIHVNKVLGIDLWRNLSSFKRLFFISIFDLVISL